MLLTHFVWVFTWIFRMDLLLGLKRPWGLNFCEGDSIFRVFLFFDTGLYDKGRSSGIEKEEFGLPSSEKRG